MLESYLHFTRLGDRVRTTLTSVRTHLEERPILDLVAPLTLVLLLLYPVGLRGVRIVLQVGAVAGLVYRPLQRRVGYWVLLALVMGVGCLTLWHDADNHKYLITYWCLALGLSCAAKRPAKALRINARLLVGLCFLLAVIWKIRTPDFITGAYYQFSMLTDERLFSVGRLVTGMSPEVYTTNHAAIDRLTAYSSTLDRVAFDGAALLRPLSKVLVTWTLLVESWIFASFLWPGPSRWAVRSRYVSLLVFIVTTYAVAHVGGFAWILTIMGLAQVRPQDATWRLVYLGGLVVVILYQFDPVAQLIQALY